jgi:hypothetical protein
MRFPIVAAAILILTLAGCGGDSEKPEAAEIKAGTCIAKDVADENDRAPDFGSVVPCSEPHVYEILEVLDLPENALSGKTDKEKLANRKDLANLASTEDDEASAENDAYFEFAFEACNAALLETTGYDRLTVDGVDAADALVYPALGQKIVSPWLNVSPQDHWLDDQRQLICSARFVKNANDTEGDGPVQPQSSANDKPLLSAIGSSSFPVELRDCNTFDTKDVSRPIGCDKQHYGETLFVFDAESVFDEKFVKGIDPEKPTDKEMDELDRVCAEAFPAVMSEGYDKSKVRGKAFIGTYWETDDYKTIGCELTAVDSKTKDLGPGSLVWTDAKNAELVDAR